MTATVDSATTHKDGRVVAIFGPVVDVEFPPDGLPEINTALEMDIELEGTVIKVTAGETPRVLPSRNGVACSTRARDLRGQPSPVRARCPRPPTDQTMT